MPDDKTWMTSNLNINIPGSYEKDEIDFESFSQLPKQITVFFISCGTGSAFVESNDCRTVKQSMKEKAKGTTSVIELSSIRLDHFCIRTTELYLHVKKQNPITIISPMNERTKNKRWDS
jgi:hypothetical protein